MKKETAAEIESRIALENLLKLEDEQLAAVSKRHAPHKVLMLKVPVDDTYRNFKYGYIKYPDRIDVSIAMTMQATDPLKGKQIVLENSWLEGDRALIDDTELFLATCTALDTVLSVRQAVVKKNY